MRFPTRALLKTAVCLSVLSPCLTPASPAARPDATRQFEPLGSASFRPEVRLRKLHLVRPDLIPYPIAYEVYC